MSTRGSVLTQEGQITILAEIRARLGWKPRDRIEFEVDGDELKLRPAESTLLAGYGAVEPLNRLEDYRRLREQFEEDVAADVAAETE